MDIPKLSHAQKSVLESLLETSQFYPQVQLPDGNWQHASLRTLKVLRTGGLIEQSYTGEYVLTQKGRDLINFLLKS